MSAGKVRKVLSNPEPKLKILNNTDIAKDNTKSASDVAKSLQRLMLRMKGEAMSEDGNEVNYEKIKKSKLFKEYCQMTSLLNGLDLGSLTEKERMAFFINVYNALTIHGIVECDSLPDSVLNVKLFWKTTAYRIGGQVFTLDDIEHGILRGNRPHPGSKTTPFSETDPRLKYTVVNFDPRIHFALVCGAKSCPAINVYSAENLDAALAAAAKTFCEQEVRVYDVQRQIKVSKIFQWYKDDFGKTDIEAIRWTAPYISSEARADLDDLLYLLEHQGMVDIKYFDYDWNINAATRRKPPLPVPAEPVVREGKS